ncbi:MAG TPA: glycerol-3-phosphate acyltransferase [Candidatus Pacearchaeota archaeon]|nr:glycerol-3-phosphate acyltransferase [Candidatus Pacearchaeota archaeon]
MFIPVIYYIFSYLVGSIPFSYIIPYLFGRKNIMSLGWNKSSASNVFKHVGHWQGFLAGFLDIAKGYFVVWLAYQMGGEIDAQIYGAALAVLGHNWSIFLHFDGGRGIGTLVGALLFLAPKMALCFAGIILFFGLFWDMSIGTIVGIFFLVFFAEKIDFTNNAGVLASLVFFPIFLKRLSPLKEVFYLKIPIRVFWARLIFDDNDFHGFRIVRIFRKLTKH